MIISAYGFEHVTHAPDVVLDPSRIAAQVITGIGFIGAGTIVLRQNVVRGLTTAASVWAAAALGLAAGGGLYFASTVSAVLILGILAGLKSLERRFSGRYRRSALMLVVRRDAMTLGEVQKIVDDAGVQLDRIDLREAKDLARHDRISLIFSNSDRDRERMTMLLDAFRNRAEVTSIRSTLVIPRRKRVNAS